MAADGDDEVVEGSQPRTRPVRIVVAGVLAVLGLVGATMSWFVIHPSHPPPEPQGSAAAIGRSLVPFVAWISLIVCALVAVVAAITLAIAIREARAARLTSPT